MLSDNYEGIVHKIVQVPNIKHKTFISVLQFVYTGRLQYSQIDDAYDILAAADFYGLHSLNEVHLQTVWFGNNMSRFNLPALSKVYYGWF